MFNPQATLRQIPIPGHKPCLVIDNFLLDPDAMVAFAAERRDAFAHQGGNFFPGPEVDMGAPFSALLGEYFTLHVRRLLGARRTLEVSSRLSMVTRPPALLHPAQRLCHRDSMVGTRRVRHEAGEAIAASVLYLFKDSGLGGTSFYVPRQPVPQMNALFAQAMAGPGPAFDAMLQAGPAYLGASNDYFEQVCTIPAAYNRAIFYDGAIFHSAQIDAPERLSQDPALGRLTLNGFFLLRTSAT
jgi:hypothetical protein